MSGRARWVALVVVVLVAVGASVLYVAERRTAAAVSVAAAPQRAAASMADIEAEPHIVFRNTALGERYGTLAMVTLADPAGPRAASDQSCDRVYSAHGVIVCLETGLVGLGAADAVVLDGALRRSGGFPLLGTPNRTRVSSDGRFVATTTFRSGDSYATPGKFSTQTLITPAAGGRMLDLEQVDLHQGDEIVRAVDRNVWGVTFAGDGDTFYATAAWAGSTWLVQGSIATARMVTLRQDAECPSLSPDGRRIVYKKLGRRGPGEWRLTVLDLATGVETQLAEQRAVDDQAEWLDAEHVLYAVPRSGASQSSEADVLVVPADGSGTPTVLIPDASSPGVVDRTWGRAQAGAPLPNP